MSRPTSRASGRTSALGQNRPLGGLSAKQYEQIASNISSARKPASSSQRLSGGGGGSSSRPLHAENATASIRSGLHSRASSRSNKYEDELLEESEEDTISFSRQGKAVFAAASPSEAAPQGTFIPSTAFASAPLNSRVPPASPKRDLPKASTSKAPQQPLYEAHNVEDDVSQASTQIQEALLVEDLLSVLMVRVPLFTLPVMRAKLTCGELFAGY